MTHDRLQSLGRAGCEHESGTQLIEPRVIGFAPVEDSIQSLKQVAQTCFSTSMALPTDHTIESRTSPKGPRSPITPIPLWRVVSKLGP